MKGFIDDIEERDPVERALAELRQCRCQSLPVIADERLAGVLTLDNVGEYVMIEAALRASEAAPR